MAMKDSKFIKWPILIPEMFDEETEWRDPRPDCARITIKMMIKIKNVLDDTHGLLVTSDSGHTQMNRLRCQSAPRLACRRTLKT